MNIAARDGGGDGVDLGRGGQDFGQGQVRYDARLGAQPGLTVGIPHDVDRQRLACLLCSDKLLHGLFAVDLVILHLDPGGGSEAGDHHLGEIGGERFGQVIEHHRPAYPPGLQQDVGKGFTRQGGGIEIGSEVSCRRRQARRRRLRWRGAKDRRLPEGCDAKSEMWTSLIAPVTLIWVRTLIAVMIGGR